MIRQLRKKLIFTCMFSLFLVLAVIVGIINVSNYVGIVRDADSVLTLLRDDPPEKPQRGERMNWRKAGRRFQSPELPFEIRYFSVTIEKDGEIASRHLDRIAAVDADAAAEFAAEIVGRKSDSGFIDSYRYLRFEDAGNTRIIFLDCGRMLAGALSLLQSSVLISLGGLAAVLALMLVLSGYIVRPFLANYNRQKQFITDAGHELKTPLTVIGADAELLQMECGDNEWLEDIRSQTKRLTELTGDLVSLARSEEAQQMTMLEFPMSDVVREAVSSFQAVAQTQGKSIHAEIQPMISFCGDEKAVSRLISILLDNALKYSPDGSDVRLELKKQNHSLLLTVENPAPGITGELLKNMFDRFYRGDSSRGAGVRGYGIGLSIARAVVMAHKGKIHAEAAGSGDLRMIVSLPV